MASPVKNRKRGKSVERQVAKKLNGRRTGILGKDDVEAGQFSVEVKSRQKFVALSWMEQAVKNCPANKIPIVCVHITGKRYDGDLVIIRLKDFKTLIGGFNGQT